MKSTISRGRIHVLAFVILFSLAAAPVSASEFHFVPPAQKVAVGQAFDARLELDTQTEEINAVQGTIAVPPDLFEVQEIRDAGSVVSLWVTRPRAVGGEVAFSGIIPGGAEETAAPILILRLLAKKEGTGSIILKDAQALLNDGKGTASTVALKPLAFEIVPAGSIPPPSPAAAADAIPPERFTPQISKDPNIFDGRWFVAFSTEDKQTGIERYEVKESADQTSGTWKAAESPYILQDQGLASYVSIKAVDTAGNERVETIPPKNAPSRMYRFLTMFGILVAIGLILLGVAVRKKKNKKK